MVTRLLSERQIKKGAEVIRSGGTVAFRTETLYGLGSDATNAEAVEKVFTAKGRPNDKPLIVLFASRKKLFSFCECDEASRRVIKRVRGAVTVVLPRPNHIPKIVCGGGDSIAVRVPACRFTRRFIRACGVPITAPSANTSGQTAPCAWEDVYADLNGRVDAIFCGKRARLGLPSTIVRCETTPSAHCRVLRLGAVSCEELRRRTGLEVVHTPSSPNGESTPLH